MDSQLATSQLSLNFTRLSKAVVALLSVGYIVPLLVPFTRQYLALVPGRTIPCVWNIFTAGLIEKDIFRLLFNLIGVLVLAKVVEPVWGSKGFLLFIGFVNFWTGFSTFVLLYLLFTVDRTGTLLYTEICGFQGVIAGMLVGVKQIMPENDVTLFGYVKFRAKHLPGIYLSVAVPAALFFGHPIQTVPFVGFGTYVAWFYLRFFQSKPELSLQGDPSDEFRFATFFPEAMHPVVDGIATVCSKVFRVGLQQSGAKAPSSSRQVPSGAPLPGSDATEAARRRERGARALEERLGLKNKATASQNSSKDVAMTQPPDIEAPAPKSEDNAK